jgi:methionyl-tRNA formyltransferase
MSGLKVAVFGFQSWGFVTLAALLEAGFDVPLVMTHKTNGAPYESIFSESVEDLAEKNGIPVLHRRYANDPEAITALRRSGADIAVASNWRTWLSPELFGTPRLGVLNIHDGLLPAYGGFAPISWSIANGERVIGVTVHVVTGELDLGPIVLQHQLEVTPQDTATSMYERSLPLFGSLAVESVRQMADGTARLRPQDPSAASFFHSRSDREFRIDWQRPRTEVWNLIRAQSDPFPNAHTTLSGSRLSVKRAHLSRRTYSGTPGRIFTITEDEGVVVVCGPTAGDRNQGLVLDEVTLDGLAPGLGKDVLADHVGAVLGEDA